MLSWLIPKKSGQSHFFQFRMPWDFREIPNFVLGYLPLKSNFSRNFFLHWIQNKIEFRSTEMLKIFNLSFKIYETCSFFRTFLRNPMSSDFGELEGVTVDLRRLHNGYIAYPVMWLVTRILSKMFILFPLPTWKVKSLSKKIIARNFISWS